MKKIELDEFCKISYVGGLSVSPNADKLCFIRSIANLENNRYDSYLWLYSENDGLRKMTTTGQDRGAKWLNEHTLLFKSSRKKVEKGTKTALYSLDVRGGEAELFLETCHEIVAYSIIDQDYWLVQIAYDPQLFELQQLQDETGIEKTIESTSGWKTFDEIPFWSNGDGYTNKKRNALGILNLKTKTVELLTDALTDVYDFDLSSDKKTVVYISNCFRSVMSIYNSLGTIDLTSKTKKDISHTDAFIYEKCQFTLDQRLVVYGKSGQHYGLNENGKFYIFDMSASSIQCTDLGPELDISVGNSVGSDVKYGSGGSGHWIMEDDGFVFTATVGYSCNLYKLTFDGKLTEITQIDGAIFDYVKLNDQYVFNALNDFKPMALFSLKDGHMSHLTQDHLVYGKTHFLSKPEHFEYQHPDGTPLDGFIMKPRNFSDSRRYPVILNIHGGPKTVYGSVYYHEMQYWASEGFVVIYCNPRGSDGKGNAFADIRGKYGSVDYEDILALVDHVVEHYPYVNHEFIGVTGGSYGGFMTNWIIGHTDRFKAAATQRSIANWVSMYGSSDIGYYFTEDQAGATPWTNVDKLWHHSPMKYADQVKTPLLIIHSEEDYRCWVVEGIQMFTAMKANGVPSKMVMFHHENHELSRSGKPLNRVKRLSEITNWMKTYLMT